MNLEQTAQLLIIIGTFDNRTVSAENITAYHEVLNDIQYEDALEAVKMHFKISNEWIMPSHIRAHVKAIRNDRAMRELPIIENTPSEQPTCKHDTPLTRCDECCRALSKLVGVSCEHNRKALQCQTCTRKEYQTA